MNHDTFFKGEVMIISDLYDTYYPKSGFSKLRSSVRGLVFKGDKVAMLHIQTNDEFGPRDHLEMPGGGIEDGEDHKAALARELNEELGVHVEVGAYLGFVIQRWNILERITFQHYYVCEYIEDTQQTLSDYEKTVISDIKWLPMNELLEYLKQEAIGINKMIHERELKVIQEYLKIVKQ